jgi:hypothetical protein
VEYVNDTGVMKMHTEFYTENLKGNDPLIQIGDNSKWISEE